MMPTLSERQALHTTREAELIVSLNAAGHLFKVVEWQRDIATQRIYLLKGVSKTLDSRHIDGLATDLYLVVNGETVYCDENSSDEVKAAYRMLGVHWEALGGRWGGRFRNDAKWEAEHGRPFNPSVDIGWDPYHVETTLA